jgi:hypothetical protein
MRNSLSDAKIRIKGIEENRILILNCYYIVFERIIVKIEDIVVELSY